MLSKLLSLQLLLGAAADAADAEIGAAAEATDAVDCDTTCNSLKSGATHSHCTNSYCWGKVPQVNQWVCHLPSSNTDIQTGGIQTGEGGRCAVQGTSMLSGQEQWAPPHLQAWWVGRAGSPQRCALSDESGSSLHSDWFRGPAKNKKAW